MACYAAATSSGCLEAALPACASRDPRVGFAVQSCGTLCTAVCGTGRLGRAGGLHVVAVEVDTLQLRAAPLLLLLVMLLMRMLCATGGGDEQRNRQGAPHGARHEAFYFTRAGPAAGGEICQQGATCPLQTTPPLTIYVHIPRRAGKRPRCVLARAAGAPGKT
jgi:hypothetical protein